MSGKQNTKNNNRGNRNNNRGNRNNNRNNNNRNNNNNPSNKAPQNKQPPANPSSQPQGGASKESVDTSNDLFWFIVLLILIAGGFLFNKYYLAPRRPGIYNSNYQSPPFRNDGKLRFLEAEAERNIIDIQVEIARSQQAQVLGLKNRKFLPANGGMLFIYDEVGPKTLTMESVYLTLDILFISQEKKIFRISKEAHPQSDASIPSGGNAKYVLQVQGGFCDAFNIRVGDYVQFLK